MPKTNSKYKYMQVYGCEHYEMGLTVPSHSVNTSILNTAKVFQKKYVNVCSTKEKARTTLQLLYWCNKQYRLLVEDVIKETEGTQVEVIYENYRTSVLK
jgi:hypothetical protein